MATKAQSVRSHEQRKNSEKKRKDEERDSVKLQATNRTSAVVARAPRSVRPSPRSSRVA